LNPAEVTKKRETNNLDSLFSLIKSLY